VTGGQSYASYDDFVLRNTLPCIECGKPYYHKPSRPKHYCSNICRRRYFEKRFDRWIANPQEIALPQAFDEFLTQNELPCLVKGCNWSGKQLSNHMNAAHGVPKDEFKRAAGFNLSSGIISAELAERLSQRERTGIAVGTALRGHEHPSYVAPTRNYISLERREHYRKVRALSAGEPGPVQTCRQCGKEFQQTTRFGKTLYCSTSCRSRFYAGREKHSLTCGICGKSFLGSRAQARRVSQGAPVVCSMHCRQILNARSRQRKG
jgi:hypothetical protein